MAKRVSVGDVVYIPVERIAPSSDVPHALIKGQVRNISGRSLDVDLPYRIGVVRIASSLVHKTLGVCLIRIGDISSEPALIDPLGKSVLQYLRLLIPDDQLKSFSIRTKQELYEIYSNIAPGYTHFIIVGHGASGNLCFAFGESESATDLSNELASRCNSAKVFISLCCRTGDARFAKQFSMSNCCQYLISPFGAVHGAVASQFLQTLFGYHFLEGRTLKIAFRNARKRVPGGACFRIWNNGTFEGRA